LDMHGLDAEWLVWNGWFDRAGLPRPTPQARRFNNYVIALQAARENQGVALGWHSQVKPLIDAGKLVRLTSAAIPAPGAFYVTWDANRSLSHAALTLREWLSGEVALR
jgi:DNA-binding transcriptional LysR family regulator